MKIIKVYKSLSAILFYLSLVAIIAGINFSDGSTPGWFLQQLAVPDDVQDIFFIDSLRGWVVTKGYAGTSDTGYIMHTTNGGYNWTVQIREPLFFLSVQFTDTSNGYVVGGTNHGNIQKTTNGGNNWTDISGIFTDLFGIEDLAFVNKDTGWICIHDLFGGGVWKTVNGGGNWINQTSDPYSLKLCFINKDTGWYCTNQSQGKLYRTTNGGTNWTLQYTASDPFYSLFFLNKYKGWALAGYGMYTTDGGFSWTNSQGASGGYDIKFINENIGYAGNFLGPPARINKSTDGGVHWGYQITPYLSENLVSVLKNDTLKAWAGNIMHTTDGGGPIIYTGIKPSINFLFSFTLKQNYPNPFNPSTKIRFEINKSSYVDLLIYDITGKEVTRLINNKLYSNTGSYEMTFEPSKYNLSSGIYIYLMKASTIDGKEVFIDSKKMMFVK